MDLFATNGSVRLGFPSLELFQYPYSRPDKLALDLRPPPLNDSPLSVWHPFRINPEFYRISLQLGNVISFVVIYISAVLFMNQVNAARGWKPWAFSKSSTFKALVVAHNILLAVFSAWSLIATIFLMWNYWPSKVREQQEPSYEHIAEYFCQLHSSAYQVLKNSNSISPTEAGLSYLFWLFHLSKFYEVVDTMILLAKGKKSSNLQTYHHAGIIICTWTTMFYESPTAIVGALNLGVHTLMYTYFALQTLGISVSLSTKRALTSIQITQFFVGLVWGLCYPLVSYRVRFIDSLSESGSSASPNHEACSIAERGWNSTTGSAAQDTFVPCLSDSGEAATVVVSFIYIWPLIILFIRFFIKSYTKGKRS
ncbi:uncharacterized protein N7483_010615 [Penicillium malachiteum]|uniref:uncharacterized protein n=1 Tax=Penicillium malachiteum TaxID=1324776 RepID=UPI00254767E3|nr:uncharacterized protein N7483_010615 [Penicillium malachiteum]KAJ5713434.1 hypothetical protein N7483_010615 [Penicillium malachiteum]